MSTNDYEKKNIETSKSSLEIFWYTVQISQDMTKFYKIDQNLWAIWENI